MMHETMTVKVEKCGFSVTLTAAEYHDPVEFKRAVDHAEDVIRVVLERNEATPLCGPKVMETTSWVEHVERRPLPRRWWHHLLFRTPVEAVMVPHAVNGFREGAVCYVLRVGLYAVKAPPEVADRLRMCWARGVPRPVPLALAYPAPPTRAWEL